MKLLKSLLVIVVAFIALALVLTACEQPTPTPTESPISPLPLPQALTDPVTGTTRLFWDDPLVETGTVCISTISAECSLTDCDVLYICEPPELSACVNYPFTRTVPIAEVDAALVFTFTLVLDSEARIDNQVIDAYTLPSGLLSASEPGVGQYNGAIPWSWQPDIPVNYIGTVEIWKRKRWVDVAGNLPDVLIPYDTTDNVLHESDERGFFLTKVITIPVELHVVYLPIVARRAE